MAFGAIQVTPRCGFGVFGVVCFIKNKNIEMTLKGSHTNSPDAIRGKERQVKTTTE
jgi:hypothetical protein